MAIGERIRFFRTMRGMTLKQLGLSVGFPERSADIRMAQYESGTRTPKADLTALLAQALDVAPAALTVPDIDSDIGLVHTLFTLEDRYGLEITADGDSFCFRIRRSSDQENSRISELLSSWARCRAAFKAGTMTSEEYDEWRCHCPDIQAEPVSAEAEPLSEPEEEIPSSVSESRRLEEHVKKLHTPLPSQLFQNIQIDGYNESFD